MLAMDNTVQSFFHSWKQLVLYVQTFYILISVRGWISNGWVRCQALICQDEVPFEGGDGNGTQCI